MLTTQGGLIVTGEAVKRTGRVRRRLILSDPVLVSSSLSGYTHGNTSIET